MSTKTSGRAANFSAGPSALPEAVLLEAQKDLFDYKGCGMSVMEMSHRSKMYADIWNQAQADIRELINIPPNYKVLFLQGGATSQFSAVPLNLNLRASGKPVDMVVTGTWSAKACKEAEKYGKVNVAVDTKGSSYTKVPPSDDWKLSDDAAYLHICVNETIHGVMMKDIPDVKCPIVADYSSCFMSAPIDVAKFGVIFAGAQKNIGPAGATVVIVREDLMGLGKQDPLCPVYMNWSQAKEGLLNTPPTWSIYVMGLVFKWLKALGGVEVMEMINIKKAAILYDYMEASEGYYRLPVEKSVRSLMNVRYNIKGGTPDLEAKFLKETAALGIHNLKGHRTLGGLRASIYNAQPLENIHMLVDFMKKFKAENP